MSLKRSQLSFDGEDRQSMLSKSQSRYMETMGELTSSLAEAYHKINELSEKVEELEQAKTKV